MAERPTLVGNHFNAFFLSYRKQHLTFYYQYEDSYNENISAFEASAILNSRILLFVVTADQRSLSSMIMVSLLYFLYKFPTLLNDDDNDDWGGIKGYNKTLLATYTFPSSFRLLCFDSLKLL